MFFSSTPIQFPVRIWLLTWWVASKRVPSPHHPSPSRPVRTTPFPHTTTSERLPHPPDLSRRLLPTNRPQHRQQPSLCTSGLPPPIAVPVRIPPFRRTIRVVEEKPPFITPSTCMVIRSLVTLYPGVNFIKSYQLFWCLKALFWHQI